MQHLKTITFPAHALVARIPNLFIGMTGRDTDNARHGSWI